MIERFELPHEPKPTRQEPLADQPPSAPHLTLPAPHFIRSRHIFHPVEDKKRKIWTALKLESITVSDGGR